MDSSEPTDKQWEYAFALEKKKSYRLEEVMLRIHMTLSGDPMDKNPKPKSRGDLTRFDLAKLIDWLIDQPDQDEAEFLIDEYD